MLYINKITVLDDFKKNNKTDFLSYIIKNDFDSINYYNYINLKKIDVYGTEYIIGYAFPISNFTQILSLSKSNSTFIFYEALINNSKSDFKFLHTSKFLNKLFVNGLKNNDIDSKTISFDYSEKTNEYYNSNFTNVVKSLQSKFYNKNFQIDFKTLMYIYYSSAQVYLPDNNFKIQNHYTTACPEDKIEDTDIVCKLLYDIDLKTMHPFPSQRNKNSISNSRNLNQILENRNLIENFDNNFDKRNVIEDVKSSIDTKNEQSITNKTESLFLLKYEVSLYPLNFLIQNITTNGLYLTKETIRFENPHYTEMELFNTYNEHNRINDKVNKIVTYKDSINNLEIAIIEFKSLVKYNLILYEFQNSMNKYAWIILIFGVALSIIIVFLFSFLIVKVSNDMLKRIAKINNIKFDIFINPENISSLHDYEDKKIIDKLVIDIYEDKLEEKIKINYKDQDDFYTQYAILVTEIKRNIETRYKKGKEP